MKAFKQNDSPQPLVVSADVGTNMEPCTAPFTHTSQKPMDIQEMCKAATTFTESAVKCIAPPTPKVQEVEVCEEDEQKTEEDTTTTTTTFLYQLAQAADQCMAKLSFVDMVEQLESVTYSHSELPSHLAGDNVSVKFKHQHKELEQKLLRAMLTVRMVPNTIERLRILPCVLMLEQDQRAKQDDHIQTPPKEDLHITPKGSAVTSPSKFKCFHWTHALIAVLSSLPLAAALFMKL